MAGRTIGHYTIASLLGAGGMGEVYLAQDSRLGRNVALKLLPAEFTEDDDRVRRFQQEARAASALNHPNIITVYEIGQADGQHFIATEFIDGETLRIAINSARVEVNKLLELLAQVADGLAKAHASGIIHRDLKPDNIMITRDGYAKVLDFGLAKLVEARTFVEGDPTEAATALVGQTQHGVVMGTAGYMAPEQAEGRPADHRSDVFSFGCILYQTVTRHKPFDGETFIDVLHKIVYTDPVPVAQFSPRCPAELQRIIRKCMAKDPNRRYQCIKDAAIDLRALVEDFDKEPSSMDPRAISYSGVHASGGWRESGIQAAPAFEVDLTDEDAPVRQISRFSKASLVLAILAIAGAAIVGPTYQRASVDSDFRLECPKVVALNKAREALAGFGYESSNLEDAVSFEPTELSLKRVVSAEGLSGARRAVGEGKSAVWKIALARRALDPSARLVFASGKRRPGEFLVWIDARGRLVNFATAPREDEEIAPLEREEAIETAQATVKRVFSIDPGPYDLELIRKSNPPGVTEITWRNHNLVFGHREVIHVDLQGAMVTRLSRSLEPLQTAQTAADEKSALATGLENFKGAIAILAFLAAGILGLVFMIRGRRWFALRRRLPLVASLIVLIGVGSSVWATNSWRGEFWFIQALVSVILALLLSAICFFGFAGLFEWLRVINPARLYAAEQLSRGRLLSRPVGASLVYGSLAGALLAGINGGFNVLKSSAPGYSPTSSLSSLISYGSPIASGLAALAAALAFVVLVAVIIELTQRLIRDTRLSAVIPVVILALGSAELTGIGARAVLLNLLSWTLVAVVLVQTYRSRGFLALFVVTIVSGCLELSARVYYIGDPSLSLEVTLMLGALVLLMGIGVWAYVGEPIKKRLSAFGLG